MDVTDVAGMGPPKARCKDIQVCSHLDLWAGKSNRKRQLLVCEIRYTKYTEETVLFQRDRRELLGRNVFMNPRIQAASRCPCYLRVSV